MDLQTSSAIDKMTITQLEMAMYEEGYKVTKKYDGVKGICIVTLTSRDGGTIITDANRTRNSLWPAYRRAMQLALQQIRGQKV